MLPRISEVSAAEVADPLPDGVVVLDVREPDEWAAGHIEGALHIPLMEVVQRVGDVPSDERVLVVCRVGVRSAQATAFLQAQGRDVANLEGGMVAWASAGRAMVSETEAPPTVEFATR